VTIQYTILGIISWGKNPPNMNNTSKKKIEKWQAVIENYK